MKLTRIPGAESTVKQSYSFRASTVDLLEKYKSLYERTTGSKVALKDLVEQMLIDFMSGDNDFQKFLRDDAVEHPEAVPVKPRPDAPPHDESVAI